MPVTPFHLGVGLAAKAALGSHFHLGFFAALQVATDLESLYNLVYRRDPVHRGLHTFAGAAILATAASVLALGAVIGWRSLMERTGPPLGATFLSLLATALFATWSHVILDSVMHWDMRPFAPFSNANPMLGIVGLRALHLGCVALGAIGLFILVGRWALPGD